MLFFRLVWWTKEKLVLTYYFRVRSNYLYCKGTSSFKRENQVDIIIFFKFFCICDALRVLVPFVQFKKQENTHGGMLLLVKLHTEAKRHTPPFVFFTFFKLCRWCQIVQRITELVVYTRYAFVVFEVFWKTGKRSTCRVFLYSKYLKNCGHNEINCGQGVFKLKQVLFTCKK